MGFCLVHGLVRKWTRTDGKNILFPNMSTAAHPAALFAGPTVVLNGRRYATASPLQFCLFPFPFSSSPTAPGPHNVLLMRRISDEIPATLGPIFWASRTIPPEFEEASARQHVVSSSAVDAVTLADLRTLANISTPPCARSSSTKCEACVDGCGNTTKCERTHYQLPGMAGDMILERGQHKQLLYAHRHGMVGGAWGSADNTSIPDVNSNLNAGTLPDGRVYLVSNPCPNLTQVCIHSYPLRPVLSLLDQTILLTYQDQLRTRTGK